jgi:hypothetical protein
MNHHVGHKLDPQRDLVCDAAMTPLHEAPADPAHPRRRKAFYVPFAGGYIGAFSSPAGPMLFVNGERYAFTDPSWSIRVAMQGDTRRAVFDGLRSGPLTIDYAAFEPDPADTWADERLDDFYQWLAAKRDDRELIAMWTDRTP